VGWGKLVAHTVGFWRGTISLVLETRLGGSNSKGSWFGADPCWPPAGSPLLFDSCSERTLQFIPLIIPNAGRSASGLLLFVAAGPETCWFRRVIQDQEHLRRLLRLHPVPPELPPGRGSVFYSLARLFVVPVDLVPVLVVGGAGGSSIRLSEWRWTSRRRDRTGRGPFRER